MSCCEPAEAARFGAARSAATKLVEDTLNLQDMSEVVVVGWPLIATARPVTGPPGSSNGLTRGRLVYGWCQSDITARMRVWAQLHRSSRSVSPQNFAVGPRSALRLWGCPSTRWWQSPWTPTLDVPVIPLRPLSPAQRLAMGPAPAGRARSSSAAAAGSRGAGRAASVKHWLTGWAIAPLRVPLGWWLRRASDLPAHVDVTAAVRHVGGSEDRAGSMAPAALRRARAVSQPRLLDPLAAALARARHQMLGAPLIHWQSACASVAQSIHYAKYRTGGAR